MVRIAMLGTACLGLGLGLRAEAQKVPVKEDSGWVSLFNGRNFDGLYVRSGAMLRDPAVQTTYKIEGDSIHVAGGSGLLTTRKVYSRYQMRVKYKYAKTGTGQNAGLQYHVEPTDFDSTDRVGTQNVKVPYYFGRSFVQSIEFQTYVSMAGAFIGIGNLWARTTVASGQKYSPGGTAYIATPSGGGSRYIYPVNHPDNSIVYTRWVQCQINVHGADSVLHFVNGLMVVKAWKLRHVVEPGSGADNYVTDTSAAVPMGSGHIGLQAEGADIYYRDWDIRLLDAQGRPIIPGCMNPQSANYNPLANQDNGTCPVTVRRSDGGMGSRGNGRKPVAAGRRAIREFATPEGGADARGRLLEPR